MLKHPLAAVLLAFPAAALACEADFDEGPTNIELLERADLVVLAKVRADPNNTDKWQEKIVLEPVRTLKGSAPNTLTISGFVRDRQTGEPIRPFPTTLGQGHPSASWGSCNRAAYSPGSFVLAIFEKTPKGFVQNSGPWARTIEDVEGPNGLWVRAASFYLRIIRQNPPDLRRRAFRKERNRLLARHGDPDAKAMAQDIGWYLGATGKK